jgi:thiamine-phosphate pyrophosphorylase
MFINNDIKFYFFTNNLNEIIRKNIKNFQSLCIIYKEQNNIIDEIKLKELRNWCKRNAIQFYVADNYKLASKYKCDGIFLSNKYKKIVKFSLKKNFKIIGSAHNRFEYLLKKRQLCETIMLSPIFYNYKYTPNKILGIVKFNLITLEWDTKICALGGINLSNLKKIKMTKSNSVAFVSMINNNLKNKKPAYYF